MTPEREKEIDEFANASAVSFSDRTAKDIIKELLSYIKELRDKDKGIYGGYDMAVKENPCKGVPTNSGPWGEQYGTHYKLIWAYHKKFYSSRKTVESIYKAGGAKTMEWLD